MDKLKGNDFLKKLRDFNKKGLKDFLNLDYVFNKTVFRVMLVTLALFILAVMWSQNFDFKPAVYLECNAGEGKTCENPFYKKNIIVDDYECPFSDSVCEAEFFPNGFSVGNKPSWLARNSVLFILIIIFVFFVFNHIKYNGEGGENVSKSERIN